MEAARIPHNEAQRLMTLHRYGILDTDPEDAYDEIAELAATICEAPVSLVTLIDHSRQWFKARIGMQPQQTARNVSFCAHAILQPDLFVVPDTHADPRFADNPLVTDSPHIRFYAGAPLLTRDGIGLGTLCVIDHVPRQLEPHQEKALLILRTHVLKLLELRLKSRELAEANHELDTFSYTVSHDLRAPLRTIEGFSQILLEDHTDNLNSEGRLLVSRIQNAARKLDQLTLDLLSLSKIERGPIQVIQVDLSRLANDIVADLRANEPSRNVEVNIQPNLVVMGDPGLLESAIRNLLDNAWKYTRNISHPLIEFGSKTQENQQTFFLRDNGVGFEMAYAKNLFQPFQRLHSNDEYAGTGIGLATVKRIIHRHGGSIRAEAYPGKGATFYFTFPTLI